MKLSKLKSGMLVQFREGGVFMNIDGMLVMEGAHQGIDSYNSDLTHPTYKTMDIVKVSKVMTDNLMRPEEWNLGNLNGNLKWKEGDFDFKKGDFIGYTEDGETVEFIILVTDAGKKNDELFSGVVTKAITARKDGVGYYCENWDKNLINDYKWVLV